MTPAMKALLVHLFTASGAVFAMLAMLAAVDGKWSLMFLWLVVAFLVDGIDGPLARRYHVKANAPQIDGVLMDLIIDYLTYVFIPAYALFKSGLLPGWTGWIAIIVITFASAIYFADTRMKTKDNFFRGFPVCWNMVVFTLFATELTGWTVFAVVVVCSAATFAPVNFVHPVRVQRLRPLTLSVMALWSVLGVITLYSDFASPTWVKAGLVVTSLYLFAIGGIVQALRSARGTSGMQGHGK